eukprot:3769470-Rhodomonas_salina.1
MEVKISKVFVWKQSTKELGRNPCRRDFNLRHSENRLLKWGMSGEILLSLFVPDRSGNQS